MTSHPKGNSVTRRGDHRIELDESERIRAIHRYDILGSPPDGSFEHVARVAAVAIGTPIATVSIVDEDHVWLKAKVGLEAERIPRGPGLCASAILTDEVTVVPDALLDPIAMNNELVRGALGLRFYAAAPIVTRDGHRLGTVNVIDVAPRSISAKEKEILRGLAEIVADNLELRLTALHAVGLERQLAEQAKAAKRAAERDAATLVNALSPPRLPEIAGVDIASHYAPAADGRLAGDFYDVFPVGEDHWGFVIGDVMGHGLQAGVFSALARYGLRSALGAGLGPAAALEALNRLMLLDQESGDVRFCTAICGTVGPRGNTLELTLAGGGHPGPQIVRRNRTIEKVELRGGLLGCLEGSNAAECSVSLEAGDVILFYTDGLIEARTAGTFLGEDGVGRILAAGDLSAADAVRRVASVLDDPAVVAQDDVVLLAIQSSLP